MPLIAEVSFFSKINFKCWSDRLVTALRWTPRVVVTRTSKLITWKLFPSSFGLNRVAMLCWSGAPGAPDLCSSSAADPGADHSHDQSDCDTADGAIFFLTVQATARADVQLVKVLATSTGGRAHGSRSPRRVECLDQCTTDNRQ